MTSRLSALIGACLCFLAQSCSTVDAAKRAELAEGCAINSDCRAPYVCAFETCHSQCESTRDCSVGSRCVESERPLHVCQLATERNCTHHSDCPRAQLCAGDGQCRDACATTRDCLDGQTCVSGTCAENREIVDGRLPTAPAASGSGQPCNYGSDCPADLVCLFNRRCDVECITDKDCFVTWTCSSTRCRPGPATFDGSVAEFGEAAFDGTTGDAPSTDEGPVADSADTFGDTSVGDASDGAVADTGADAVADAVADALADMGVACTGGAAFVAVGSISLGDYHSCVVRTDGSLWCWGANGAGALGDGTTINRNAPIPVGVNVAEVSAGYLHTCARKTDGTLWCSGDNIAGQLGDGTTTARATAVQVTTLGTSSAGIGTGTFHTCARKTDGTLWCWGDNGSGQLGDGTTIARLTPTQAVTLGTTVAALALGDYHGCVRKTDGTLWCWGNNSYGQLGDGTLTTRTNAVQVTALGSSVGSASAGAAHSCARKTDGTLWCWGDNTNGQLGDGTATSRLLPVQVTALGTNVASVAVGQYHTCATRTDGTLWCWGTNKNSETGDGTTVPTRKSPVQVTALGTSASAVAAGGHHGCAGKIDGTLWCWGYNFYGEIGDKTTTDRPSPVPVSLVCP